MSSQERMEISSRGKFNELFSELGDCDEDEQKQKIEEMIGIIDGMNEQELESIFKTEMFEKIDKMIEEKKLQLGNATWVLKHIGYCNVLKNMRFDNFYLTKLSGRFEKMIVEEDKKKDKKNENLLVNLCECCLPFHFTISSELALICVPCLLKVASKKDESEEAQKEVEMALLALSYFSQFFKVEQEQYLKEMLGITEYHQEHRNLTRLAYQSAWQFLITHLRVYRSLKGEIVNELYLAREVARELEELMKCVDLMRKEEGKGEKEEKEVLILLRWIQTLDCYFSKCVLWNEDFVWLFSSIVQLFRATKDNYRGISYRCICSLKKAAERRVVKVEDLLKGEAIDTVLEGVQRQTLNERAVYNCLGFFMHVSRKLKKKTDNKMEEVKRKATKMEIFEKLEEEGYEDTITSLHETFEFFKGYYNHSFLLHISDYLVNV